MKNFVTTLILLVSAISLIAQSNKDAAAIRKVIDDQGSAWNRGDLDAFMLGYWKSDKLKFVSGDKITYGWQQTLDNYRTSYPTIEKMGKLAFTDLDITVLSRDAAFVVGSWSLERSVDNPKGKFSLLWRKIRGKWLIVADHSS